MDDIIEGIREVLTTSGDQNIADLLEGASHEIIGSGTYGSRVHSVLSTFVVAAPPKNAALLNNLSTGQREKIKKAALLFYPIQNDAPEIEEILFKAVPNKTVKKESKPQLTTNSLSTGVTYCIIVAAENYFNPDDFPKVDYAEKDANDFLETLQKLGYDSGNFALLLSNRATKSMIISKLKEYTQNTETNDRIIFYFAGHGFYEGGKNLLAPIDAIKNDKIDTCISIDAILGYLSKSQCQQKMLFIDCCHSGFSLGTDERYGEDSFLTDDLIYQFSKEEFCIGFASCKSNQKSISHPNLQNGVWSHFLNKALRGEAEGIYTKNLLFSDKLQNYLKEQTQQYVKINTDKKKDQTPIKFGIETDKFIVADLSPIFSKKTKSISMLNINVPNHSQTEELKNAMEIYKPIRNNERVLVHIKANKEEKFVVTNGIDYNFDTLNIKYNDKYANSNITITYFDANGSKVSYSKILEMGGVMSWMNEDPVESSNFGFISFSSRKEIFFEFVFN